MENLNPTTKLMPHLPFVNHGFTKSPSSMDLIYFRDMEIIVVVLMCHDTISLSISLLVGSSCYILPSWNWYILIPLLDIVAFICGMPYEHGQRSKGKKRAISLTISLMHPLLSISLQISCAILKLSTSYLPTLRSRFLLIKSIKSLNF